ncbi:septation protein SepH [Nocardioides sp.]|uniref:septation protein SepH n=1 Tax=Nocardioides sp. TaxID=35761 RepID=UPI00351900FB
MGDHAQRLEQSTPADDAVADRSAPSGPSSSTPASPESDLGPGTLHLVGLSRDRQRVMLTDAEGREYALPVTDALREVLGASAPGRAAATDLSQKVETTMTSSMRPREIQTRIRAGESAETVAAAAGTTVEAIMAYVGPVLAEREHVAERAQRASVRRAPGESAGASSARVLGDAVAAHLRGREVDPASVVWDAYRRETGRWILTATFTGERSGTAHFTYDAPGNYVLLDDDDARWLVGDVLPETPTAAEPARDDLRQVRERRLAVAPEELPLGGDEPGPSAPAAPRTTRVSPVDDELPLGPAGTPASSGSSDAATSPAAGGAADSSEPRREPEVEDDAPPRRPVQKKRGRASVPSWDEIMFGGPADDSRG